MVEEFRKHGVPIEELLHPKMIYVASAPETGKSFIIDKTIHGDSGLSGCRILKEGKMLNSQQLTLFSQLVMNPESYWVGIPLFRRFPPKFEFVIRLYRDTQYLEIFMDIWNPGWAFFHNGGYYQDMLFNWIQVEMRQLARELFPIEYGVLGQARQTIKEIKEILWGVLP